VCISWTNKGLHTINMHSATIKMLDSQFTHCTAWWEIRTCGKRSACAWVQVFLKPSCSKSI